MGEILSHNIDAGCYRLAPGVRIVGQQAICDYPLRAVRLSATALHLLRLCSEQRTCGELARELDLPVERVGALCEQLRWKELLEAGPKLPPATWPSVAIIIPSYNRAGQLERCLRSLLAVEYPASCLEITVVDDASTDNSEALVQHLAGESAAQGKTLRLVRHARQEGVAKSRNTGAKAARAELLAFIDSDCVASTGWLAELVPAFQDRTVGAVGGMIRAYERRRLLGRYEDVRSSMYMGLRPQKVSFEGPLTYLPTANFLVRRALWEKLGGFAPLTFGEDVDFCRRLLMDGWQVLYLPRGLVFHDYRTRMGAFLCIRASYASAEAALIKRHPTERRVLVIPPEQGIFAGLMLGGVWGLIQAIIQVGTRAITAFLTCRDKQWGDRGVGAWRLSSSLSKAIPCAGQAQGHLCSPQPLPVPPIRLALAVGKYSPLITLLLAGLLTLCGVYRRLRKVREQRVPIGPLAILQATVRGHLAYTYHLCRHLTRYYTLPLLITGLLLPPFLLLFLILFGVVVGVDYVRLRPGMNLGQYMLCSLLDDCAYEAGVVLGCIKQRTWKPLLPVIKRDDRRQQG